MATATIPESLALKIHARQACIGVIGMGYVGLPLGLLFSRQGFSVTGFDVDRSKVDKLRAGESYIARIASVEIAEARARGFAATEDYGIIKEMDVVIICVPTPLDESRGPDLRYITGTAECIAPHLHAGQLIVLESTTYPGTTEEVLLPILEKNPWGLKAARMGTPSDETTSDNLFYVAYSPEREDPGNTAIERQDVPKVVGGLEERAADLAAALYESIFCRAVRVSSPAAAEMTKLLENIYRCVNIALVNELKLLSLRMGIDIWEVIEAAKTKPFGFQAFYPGPGLGGHCIPVDPFYLSWKAKAFDFHTQFIELAGQINTDMPYHIVAAAVSALNDRKKALRGASVLVLGVAYKKDTDDLRESPALTIIELLREGGAKIAYNDPYFPVIGKGRKYDLQMKCADLDDIRQYDCVLILTDHTQFNYGRIVSEAQLIVDSRNATRRYKSDNVVYC